MGKTQELKIEIVNTALELGVVKAAELHNVNRKSVSLWLQKYKAGGVSALANQSRLNQKQPKRMPAEIMDAIAKIKQEQPLLSAAKIKAQLELQYSKNVIQKKIVQLAAAKVIKNGITDGQEYYAGFKKITAAGNQTLYLFYLYQAGSSLLFTALAKEKSSLHAAVYLDYFLQKNNYRVIKKVRDVLISCSDQLTAGALKLLSAIYPKLPPFQKTVPPASLKRVLQSINADTDFTQTGDGVEKLGALAAFQLIYNYQQVCSSVTLSRKEKDSLLERSCSILPFITDSGLNAFIKNEKVSSCTDRNSFDQSETVKSAMTYIQNRADLLIKSNRLSQALNYYQLLQFIASRQSDFNLQQKIWQKLGFIRQKMSDWVTAEANYTQALKICLVKNISSPLAHIYGALGVVCYLSGDLRRSHAYAEQELEIARKTGDIQKEVNALQILGTSAEAGNHYQNALNYYQKILFLVEKTGKLADKAKTLGNIGVVYFKQQKLNKAKEFYEEAIFLAERDNNRRQLCRLYGNLGVVLEKQGRNKEAMINHQLMFDLAKEQNNLNWQSAALANIGNLQLETGSYVDALNSFQKMLQISKMLRQKEKESIALANLGAVHSAINRRTAAVKYIKSAIRIALKYGYDYHLISYYHELAEIEFEEASYKKAAEYIRLSQAAADSCGNNALKQSSFFLKLKIDFLNSYGAAKNDLYNQLFLLAAECKDVELKTMIYCDLAHWQRDSDFSGCKEPDYLKLAHKNCTRLWQKTGKILYAEKLNKLNSLRLCSNTAEGI